MAIKDANILRERLARRLEAIPEKDGIVAQCLQTFVDEIDALPDCEIITFEEHESLLRRFRHLMQSDYIASFDALNNKGEYARDITKAGRYETPEGLQMIPTPVHASWILVKGVTINKVASLEWRCNRCGLTRRVEGFIRPELYCPSCHAIMDGDETKTDPNYSPFGNGMSQAEYFGLNGGGASDG